MREREATPRVASLEALCARAYLHVLEGACEAACGSAVALRAESACVPWPVRQRLLELALAGRVHDALQLQLLELLLAGVRRLCVLHVRRGWRARFLALLGSGRARGLRVLVLEDVTWFTGSPAMSAPLAAAFRALPLLRQVSLRFVCDDGILGSIGASCPLLQEIDTGGSPGVSDVGLQKMCIRANVWERAGAMESSKECACTSVISRTVRGVFLTCFLENALDLQNPLPRWWRDSVVKYACKNPCCQTLRVVNFTSTGVTDRGIQLFRSCAPWAQVKVNLPL